MNKKMTAKQQGLRAICAACTLCSGEIEKGCIMTDKVTVTWDAAIDAAAELAKVLWGCYITADELTAFTMTLKDETDESN